jgi:hypothetical protein
MSGHLTDEVVILSLSIEDVQSGSQQAVDDAVLGKEMLTRHFVRLRNSWTGLLPEWRVQAGDERACPLFP